MHLQWFPHMYYVMGVVTHTYLNVMALPDLLKSHSGAYFHCLPLLLSMHVTTYLQSLGKCEFQVLVCISLLVLWLQ